MRRTFILWNLLFATAAALWALEPGLSISQYIHTAWTEYDGSPFPTVSSPAQTPDGYLWIGTRSGLWRFDGLRLANRMPFEGQPFPYRTVFSMAVSRTGGLWLGMYRGLLSVERSGVEGYSARLGLNGTVIASQPDQNGGLWLIADDGEKARLLFVDDRRLSVLRTNVGRQLPTLRSLSPRSGGGVLLFTFGGTYACTAAATGYRCEPERSPLDGETLATKTVDIRSILRDRDGNLWVGTVGHGLYLVSNGRVQHFTRRDGLSSDLVNAIIEDREGNVWVGTENGVERFRDPKVVRWSTSEGLAGNSIGPVYAARNGDLWVVSFSGGLDVLRAGNIRHVIRFTGAPEFEILSLFEDKNGLLRAGTTRGILEIAGDRVRRVVSSNRSTFGVASSMASGKGDKIWLTDTRRIGQLEGGRIAAAAVGARPGEMIRQIASDRKGRLWIGYHRGGISLVETNGMVCNFDAGSSVGRGSVMEIFEDSTGNIWVGASESLSRFRGGRWTVWTARDGLPPGGVQAVTEDAFGRLWMVTSKGISFLSIRDGAPSPGPLQIAYYGPADGIRFQEARGLSNPRITIAADGRIWFATEDGLASVQPSTPKTNLLPPQVVIETLTVDGKRVDHPEDNPAIRGRAIGLEYTALSLTAAERVRFRYRLLPLNPDWIDLGATRRMAYAGLPPGKYRFQVTACNNDGVWNSTGATVSFTVAPRFYQTWSFALLCVAAMGTIAYGIHLMRIRSLQSRFRLILAERTRLARELHDTLLQGFAGVVYQLDAAIRQLDAKPQEGRERLARALDQADESLREAREAISYMRVPAIENQTLPEAIRKAGAQVTDGTPICFELEVKGRGRELPYEVQANLFTIAREAMTNAANHAGPSQITVTLSYAPQGVALSIQDNGSGFDVDSVCKPDHWGIAGMRERAAQIGGIVRIHSTPGGGTCVEVSAGGGFNKNPNP